MPDRCDQAGVHALISGQTARTPPCLQKTKCKSILAERVAGQAKGFSVRVQLGFYGTAGCDENGDYFVTCTRELGIV